MDSTVYFAEFTCPPAFHIAVYLRISLIAIVGIALTIIALKKGRAGAVRTTLSWSVFILTVLATFYALWVSAPGQCLRQVHWHEFWKNSKGTI